MTDDANNESAVPAEPATVGVHRRAVLRGAGAAVAGAASIPLLAACGGSSAASKSPVSAPGTKHQSAGGGSSSAPSTSPSGGGGSGTKLAPASAIPVGGGKIFDSEKVVVTQPKAGEFKCFTAVCTHMGCIVASVSGGTINCGCHGSQYNIATGAVVNGPAPQPLAPVKFSSAGNEISLT